MDDSVYRRTWNRRIEHEYSTAKTQRAIQTKRELFVIINQARARAILFEEARRAETDPGNPAWANRFEELQKLCEKTGKTHIAALGTALLAKATDLNVDVYALKRTKGGPRAYVARQLAKEVLAAHAPELEIDIGVYGREPLNNQPYFRESRISREMPVKANARPALFCLVDQLDQLDRIETEEKAREALRTYIRVRRRYFRRPTSAALATDIAVSELVDRVQRFTSVGSEGGKRAQAVAAGLLTAAFGDDRVATTRINDPDRTLPGDVGVLSPSKITKWERVFEVRDKPVSEADLHHFLNKTAAAGVTRVGMVAASVHQGPLDVEPAADKAAGLGMQLLVSVGWSSFVAQVVFWSADAVSTYSREAISAIDQRLIEFEVRQETLQEWRDLNGTADS